MTQKKEEKWLIKIDDLYEEFQDKKLLKEDQFE